MSISNLKAKNRNKNINPVLLRSQEQIPCVAYNKTTNVMFSVDYRDFYQEYIKGRIYSTIFKIDNVTKDSLFLLPVEVQLDPVKDNPIHIDFKIVNKQEELNILLAIKIINKDICQGIKKGGFLNVLRRKMKVSCLYSNIPDVITIDISNLKIGSTLYIKDINLPEGIQSIENKNFTILSISGKKQKEDNEVLSNDDTKIVENIK